MEHAVRLVCREGTLERLAADLAVHEIDVVLSDAALSPSLNVRAYSHHLGESAMLIPVPALQVEYFRDLCGLVPIGTAEGITVQFYALSIEKKIKHPAVAAIVQNARQIFSNQAATPPRLRRSGARRRRYRGARLRAD